LGFGLRVALDARALDPGEDGAIAATTEKETPMKSSRPTLARAAAALAALTTAAALALAGCGGSTVDNGAMEEDLATQLSADAGVDPGDVEVTCPEDEEAEEGNRFECTLTAPNGDEVTVEVTLTEDGESFEAVVPEQQFE
jgi:hypothetical protein